MNKQSLKIKGSKKGFTLAETAIGLAIMGAAIVGTLALLQENAKNKKKSQSLGGATNIHPVVIEGLSQLVFNVKNTRTNKNSEGLCKLFSVTSIPGDAPLAEVNLDLRQNRVRGVFPQQAWEQAFPQWTVFTRGCSVLGPWVRCLKPKFEMYPAETQNVLRSLNPIVIAQLIPRGFDPINLTSTPLFGVLPDSTQFVDAKKVLFELKSEVEFSIGGSDSAQRRKDSESKYVWVGDVPYCDKRDTRTRRNIKYFPTATGEGDSTGTSIYNSPTFSKATRPPMQVIPQKKQIQRGIAADGRLQSDPTKNIEASCNEIRFTCRNDSSTLRRYNPFFYLDYGLTYSPRNSIRSVSSSFLSPKLTVREASDISTSTGGTATDILARKGAVVNYSLDGVPYYLWPNGRFYNQEPTGPESPSRSSRAIQMAVRGSHMMRMNVSNGEEACREICSAENSRNLPYKPRLQYTLWDLRESGSTTSYGSEYPATNPLGCTACYMKNCSRFGLATFGPMNEQPAEPLDASLPECAIKNTADLSETTPKSASVESLNSDSCVAGHLDSLSGSIIFSSRDCNETLPALCFNYGTFFLAKDISSSSSAVARVNHAGAAHRCYLTALETASRQKLKDLNAQSGNDRSFNTLADQLPSKSSSNNDLVEFVNNAAQGTFLAPQSVEQISVAAGNVKLDGIRNSDYFWVGYNTDKNSNLVATLPLAYIGNSSKDQFSLFFNTRGLPVLKRHTTAPDSVVAKPSSGVVGGYVLAHHIRYRGLVKTPEVQNSGTKYEFLCRKKDFPFSFFATSGKASHQQSDGIERCRQSDGLFVPPTTPLGWAQAFTEVQAMAPNYAFPDPELARVPVLWVGLKTNGSLVQSLPFNRGEKSEAKKVLCLKSSGAFEINDLVSESERLGCPADSRRVRFSGEAGIINQIGWLMATNGTPTTEVFYVGE